MEFYFILCKPGIPENIGATARALLNMGFGNLRLVNPCDHLQDRARWMACSAEMLLEKAEVFNGLKEAVADMDLVVGTTARKRKRRVRYHDPAGVHEILASKRDSVAKVGVVFGPETAGLSAAELSRCDLVSSIPTSDECPSLNLAQAVLLYAHELSPLVLGREKRGRGQRASLNRVFLGKAEQFLVDLGVDRAKPVFARILDRLSSLSDEDIKLAHFIRRRMTAVLRSGERQK